MEMDILILRDSSSQSRARDLLGFTANTSTKLLLRGLLSDLGLGMVVLDMHIE